MGALKAGLQNALHDVELRQLAEREPRQVQTSEEAAALQEELAAAIRELETLKTKLPSEATAAKDATDKA
jgi:hypothetical protein